MLLKFHLFVNLPIFLLLLAFSFIPLWSEKILWINLLEPIKICFVTWRTVCPGVCSTDTLEECVVCVAEYSVVYMSVTWLLYRVAQVILSSLIFCPVLLPTTESGESKYPNCHRTISPFNSVNFCFICLHSVVTRVFIIVKSSCRIKLLINISCLCLL